LGELEGPDAEGPLLEGPDDEGPLLEGPDGPGPAPGPLPRSWRIAASSARWMSSVALE
jgi:hypothetical protein